MLGDSSAGGNASGKSIQGSFDSDLEASDENSENSDSESNGEGIADLITSI